MFLLVLSLALGVVQVRLLPMMYCCRMIILFDYLLFDFFFFFFFLVLDYFSLLCDDYWLVSSLVVFNVCSMCNIERRKSGVCGAGMGMEI